MTITRDVIEDLIPLYVAGEASQDTRRLIEDYAVAHPEIRSSLQPTSPLPELSSSRDLGLQALDRTRQLLDRRINFLAFAFAVSAAVFSFRFKRGEIDFLLFRDAPYVAVALLVISAILYGLFYDTCRRLVVTGLGAPHSLPLWAVGAAVASLPFTIVASAMTGWEVVRDFGVVAFFVGMALAKSLNSRGAKVPG